MIHKTLLWAGCALLWASCSDVLLPDISDRMVQPVAPADSLVTGSQTHTFYWDTLDGADAYRLRIVTPSFDAITAVLLDESTEDNRRTVTLPPGEYAWQVVASNAGYASACCRVFRLYIRNDSADDLSQQQLLLTAPAAGAFLNNTGAVPLTWAPLSAAEYYTVQASANAGFSNPVLNDTVAAPPYAWSPPAEGAWFWRVRAVNETSLTFTTWQARSFTLDRTAPAAPVPEFPGPGDTIRLNAQNPDLRWTFDAASVRDTLRLYNNAQREVLLLQTAVAAGQIDLDATLPLPPAGAPEDYFWELRSVDQAGNTSPGTGLLRFWVRL